MLRVAARYVEGHLIPREPLEIPEGTELEIQIEMFPADEQQAWEMACSRLESEWDHVADTRYDDWRQLYDVRG